MSIIHTLPGILFFCFYSSEVDLFKLRAIIIYGFTEKPKIFLLIEKGGGMRGRRP